VREVGRYAAAAPEGPAPIFFSPSPLSVLSEGGGAEESAPAFPFVSSFLPSGNERKEELSFSPLRVVEQAGISPFLAFYLYLEDICGAYSGPIASFPISLLFLFFPSKSLLPFFPHFDHPQEIIEYDGSNQQAT